MADSALPELETMDAVVEVSGIVPHDWTLWPPQMIDHMLKTVEAVNDKRKAEGKPRMTVAATRCNRAPDGKVYVQITLQTALFVEPWGDKPMPVPGKLM